MILQHFEFVGGGGISELPPRLRLSVMLFTSYFSALSVLCLSRKEIVRRRLIKNDPKLQKGAILPAF